MATTLRRMDRLAETIAPFTSFFEGFAKWNADPSIANFAVGNPQEMPLPGYVDALRRQLTPQRQGLVRLQDERAERPGGGRPQPDARGPASTGTRRTWP